MTPDTKQKAETPERTSEEFTRFQKLTKDLLSVPKKDIKERATKGKTPRRE